MDNASNSNGHQEKLHAQNCFQRSQSNRAPYQCPPHRDSIDPCQCPPYREPICPYQCPPCINPSPSYTQSGSSTGPIGPRGATGATGPTGPTGPTGTAFDAYIYNEYTENPSSTITFANLTPILIPNVRSQSDDLEYAATTGLFTCNTEGTYLFIWNLLLAPTDTSDTVVVVALDNYKTDQDFATSGNMVITSGTRRSAFVSGSTVINLDERDVVALLNRSGYELELVSMEAASGRFFAASIVALRVQ